MNAFHIKRLIPSFINHGNLCEFGGPFKLNETIEALKGKTLIFAASVGREGSGYLADVVAQDTNVYATHEARPFCNGVRLLRQSHENIFESRIFRVKLNAIAMNLSAAGKNTYLESNHMFLKTFGKYLLNETDLSFHMVSLRRPISDVILSFSSLEWFGAGYRRASNWIYKVEDSTPLARTGLDLKCEADEALAYLISEKINETGFVAQAPSSRIRYSKFAVASDEQAHRALGESLGLTRELKVLPKSNVRANVKSRRISREEIQSRILGFLERNCEALKDQGVLYLDTDRCLSIAGDRWYL